MGVVVDIQHLEVGTQPLVEDNHPFDCSLLLQKVFGVVGVADNPFVVGDDQASIH